MLEIFIKRPKLSAVISTVITLLGLISIFHIPTSQYPEITPPQIVVTAFYPGADAKTLEESVAAPIEEEVNGVENMLYMSSTCSNTGIYVLRVTFAVGTDPDIDQINLQNRLQLAIPKLPKEVVEIGLEVRKRASGIMAAISFYSEKRDMLFLSNFVSRYIKDELIRIKGVSDVIIFGEKEYSMRIWLDPDRLTSLGLTVSDVIRAIREQNIQAALGAIGSPPIKENQKVQYIIRAKGRLRDVEEFENIIVRTNEKGGIVRIKDIAKVELGARSYTHQSILNGVPAVTVAIYKMPGANSIKTMEEIRKRLKQIPMPEDIKYKIILDTTKYVKCAIREIRNTLFLTFFIVIIVIFIFLRNLQATLIPASAVPVSIIGVFPFLLIIGYSANTVSLFALILAIGLVVDDAIIVVENVHRIMEEEGISPEEATPKAIRQVIGPIVSTTLVLLSVFVPVGFIKGIPGKLYRQFAFTICTAVVISSICAISLSPALCATVLRPVSKRRSARIFEKFRKGYVSLSRWLLKKLPLLFSFFIFILIIAYFLFKRLSFSFLPPEDQGYFFFNVQLPENASLPRTSRIIMKLTEEIRKVKGVSDVIGVSGYSFLSGSADNLGFGVVILRPWNERKKKELHLFSIMRNVQKIFSSIPDADIFAFPPPQILGLGKTGGFDLRILAKKGQSPQELASVVKSLIISANKSPVLTRVFTTYRADSPQIYIEIERRKAKILKVPISRIYSTLQAYFGSYYINDFNFYGRVYQVKIQAKREFRDEIKDIRRIYVRSDLGEMIPLQTLIKISHTLGPPFIYRYNLFPSAQINGEAAFGFSSGDAIREMERIMKRVLPEGFSYEWSSVSFQEIRTKGQLKNLFFFALIFTYLILVALYESWLLPLAIIFYVPISTFGALLGLNLLRISLSIYAQIGIILLIALATKNAILIVEFARDKKEEGLSTFEAATEAARIRFRPVLMTAFTFIFGVIPLLFSKGAGAISRIHIGATVFFGMLIATTVGIFFIPGFYFVIQSFIDKIKR